MNLLESWLEFARKLKTDGPDQKCLGSAEFGRRRRPGGTRPRVFCSQIVFYGFPLVHNSIIDAQQTTQVVFSFSLIRGFNLGNVLQRAHMLATSIFCWRHRIHVVGLYQIITYDESINENSMTDSP